MLRRQDKTCLESLSQAPEEIVRLTSGLTDAELRWKDAEGNFSVLENICHLRDIEIEGYTARIKRILEENNPSLADIDGSRLAIEREYNLQDPHVALQTFATARLRNIQTLKALAAEQFDREGQLEGVGTVTIRQLLEMMHQHDEDHLRDLTIIHRRHQRSTESGSVAICFSL